MVWTPIALAHTASSEHSLSCSVSCSTSALLITPSCEASRNILAVLVTAAAPVVVWTPIALAQIAASEHSLSCSVSCSTSALLITGVLEITLRVLVTAAAPVVVWTPIALAHTASF